MEESPSSLNDSFDDQEREVADILLDLPHLVRKDIVKRFGPYWGSKKTRSAISVPPSPTESVSPSAIAAPPCTKVKTVPDNFMTLKYDQPLSDQPLPTVPSTSYATTSIKIKDKSLCVQPLSTVPSSSYTNTTIKFNDGSPSPGATTSVCHREPKPLRKNTKKKVFRTFTCFLVLFFSVFWDCTGGYFH